MNATSELLEMQMRDIGRRAKAVSRLVRDTTPDERTAALEAMARQLRVYAAKILDANAADMAKAAAAELAPSAMDRLLLNKERLDTIAQGVETIAALPDPVGQVTSEWTRPNGLRISRVRTPIGVIGMIFESRPNVAADASALALRAGNVIVMRGGSDSIASVTAICVALRAGLAETAIPVDAIQIAPSADRAAVGFMLSGLDGALDVIVPRGGKGLVARVQQEARVPVFAHLEGVCHTYVHSDAQQDKAIALAVNGKMRRVSVCGATETLLIDRAVAPVLLPAIAGALVGRGCTLRGDNEARAIVPMEEAAEADWSMEYLAPILSVRVVEGLDEAISHIAQYGSQHTDCIVTEDQAAAERFLREVDSAIVLHNASTQFADGGEFGFGGEIGIATGRLHARGPVGAEQLTTFKYVIHGDGQTRP